MADKCKECGCLCGQCRRSDENHADMHLHVEIEHLRQRLLERDSHIVTMETQFLNEADKFPNGELASIKEEMLTWQEKYSRLYEAHKRVQKVNQNLEDKLLKIVDKCETEKSAFTKDIATLSHRLADANYTIHRLTHDNEKYRNDVNLAIQLLQCKPSNFVSHRYDSLPSEVQAKVRTYVAQKRGGALCNEGASPPDVKSITVPISTFPPTAMVYNVSKTNNVEKDSDDESDDTKPPVDIVSAAIMAKVLEERERERVFAKHCDTCTCHRSILTNDVETQTDNFLDNCDNADDFHAENDNKSGNQNLAPNPNEEWSDLTCSKRTEGTSFRYVNEKPFGSTKNSVRNKEYSNNKNDNYTLYPDAKGSFTRKTHSPMRQATFNHNNTSDKISARQTSVRNAKKSESQSIYRLSKTGGQSTKYKPLPSSDIDLIDLKPSSPPQRQIDVINDRIWKNEWSKSSLTKSTETCGPVPAAEQTIDVINDRTWKTADGGSTAKPRLTLIEVKPLIMDPSTTTNLHNHQLSEETASPSFSSDSLVISSSDPPSTSSDTISQPGNNRLTSNKMTVNNINNSISTSLMSNWQDRTTGPRGCSMRITPGSKNILLDNAGNYQTVLYTSGPGGKPHTALVHTAKSNKSCGSTSTSSTEDIVPAILPTDNTQLQRVAEWIKASGPIERLNSAQSNDDMSIKTLNNALSKIKDGKLLGNEKKSNLPSGISLKIGNSLARQLQQDKTSDKPSIDGRSNFHNGAKDGNTDLISFESPVEERRAEQLDPSRSIAASGTIMDVKVTREMEETYLKLAASLDPANLELSSSQNADITIEKYRKDYKRTLLPKYQDKTPGSTS